MYAGLPEATVIEVKLRKLGKAERPMLVTPSGIVIEVSLKQPEKAKSSMLVTGKVLI